MKKLLLLALCASLLGCASTRLESLATVSPVGVVAVTANADILWYGEDASSDDNSMGLGTALVGLATAKKDAKISTVLSRTDNIVNQADATFLTLLGSSGLTVVADKNAVTGAPAYQNYRGGNSTMGPSSIVSALQYKMISPGDKSFTVNLAKQAGLQGVLYLNWNFSKQVTNGLGKTGSLQAMADLQVIIKDAAGNTVHARSYYGRSNDTIAVVAGVYDPQALADLFPVAIELAIQAFLADF